MTIGTSRGFNVCIHCGFCTCLSIWLLVLTKIHLCQSSIAYSFIPALRTVGNIVTGDDNQTQFVIDNKVHPHLYQFLIQNHKKSIKKEAGWTISNITAGNRAQIQAVIEANIILPL